MPITLECEADLLSAIQAIQPSNMNAFIRAYALGTPADIPTSIDSVGYFTGFSGRIKASGPGASDIYASIFALLEVNLSARITGWHSVDMGASISHNYVAPGLRGLIHPSKSVYVDMGVFVRPGTAATTDIPLFIRGVISAHTGPKERNIQYWRRPFLSNKFVLGSRGGLTFLTPEAIFAFSPDLSASIYGTALTVSNLSAFLRAYTATSVSFGGAVVGVTPKVFVNKVLLNYVLFKSLQAYLTQVGEFSHFGASIKSIQHTSTGTSADAGYTYTLETIGVVLFGGSGLIVTSDPSTSLKWGSFSNSHPSPDLNARLLGWAQSELLTSINVYPYVGLPCSIRVLDISRLSSLSAVIQSQHPSDFGASVASTGYFVGLPTLLNVAGAIASLPTSIVGYPEVLGREFIAIHTKPFENLAATINYNQSFSCSVGSGLVGLPARISPYSTSSSGLLASIVALRGSDNLTASIMGRKRVRLRFLDIYYRTSMRASTGIYGSITGWKREVASDIAVSITGVHHEEDLAATISAIRLRGAGGITAKEVTLVDVQCPQNRITAEILFGSGVSSYIYDAAAGVVYSTDTAEQWTVLIREKRSTGTFFDRPEDLKSKLVSVVTDYDSFDEAVRAAFDSMMSPFNESLSATISATGGTAGLGANVYSDSLDKISNLSARIYEVRTIPDLAAVISAAGHLGYLGASIKTLEPSNDTLQTSIQGWGEDSLSAEIVAVT